MTQVSGLISQFELLYFIQIKNPADTQFYLIVFCLILLLFFSALASGSEGALFSLSTKERDKIRKSKLKTDKRINSLLQHQKKLLATILIFNNLINISIVILFTLSFNHYYRLSHSGFLSFLFEVIFITLILVVFGELLPKIYATRNSYRFSKFVALPVTFLNKIFHPFTYILIKSTQLIDERNISKHQGISADEIRHAIEITGDKSQGSDEKTILKRIISFGNVSVKQIMTPRINVVAFEKNMDFDTLLVEIKQNKFSRVPVYDENPDNICGILYIKDLLPYLDKNTRVNWHKLIRQPYFVPETKKIDDLLRDFQTKKVHMAVVVDEFGGFSGIATLEDVLEEIVGEISDEFDETAVIPIKKISENIYQVNASLSLSDLVKTLNLPEDIFENYSGEVDTIGGLVVEILGSIPAIGNKVNIKNLEIIVSSADEKKVKEVTVKILNAVE